MSLTEYANYKTYRNSLNRVTDDVHLYLPSKNGDEFTICVTDSIKKNVWFIEVLRASSNNNSVTVGGPCIHLVFDNGACPTADEWINFFNAWNGWDGNMLANLISARSFDTYLFKLNKCEIYGSFNINNLTRGITLNGVFKNDTINPSDDNMIKVMNAGDSAKVGAFVTYLTTYNSISAAISRTNGCSFLHGVHSAPAEGAMSNMRLSSITG